MVARAAKVGGVSVVVRVRPTLSREIAFDNAVEVVSGREIVLFKNNQELASEYDAVLPESSTQEDVYATIRQGILASIQGYNNTIFAYGQTGTGKTYTMMGNHGVDITDELSAERTLGIIPRAVREMFEEAKALEVREGAVVSIAASYMEIYNDRLYDLLQPYKRKANRDPLDMVSRKTVLEVREDGTGSSHVPNLLNVKVKSYQSVLQLISKGNKNRAVRHTEMNMSSSRSHAILQLVLEQWPGGGSEGRLIRSKLNFVDLAGSERWNVKTEMMAEHVNELTSINSSLSALANVVAALTEGNKHIPYRDSKLTHLLQDSLGGNCRTTIIATISPSVDSFEESCATLKFADRVSSIGNNPIVNTTRDMASVLALKEKEIQRLRQMLSTVVSGGGTVGPPPEMAPASDLVGELEALKKAFEAEREMRTQLEMRLQQRGDSDDDMRGNAAFPNAANTSGGGFSDHRDSLTDEFNYAGQDMGSPPHSGHYINQHPLQQRQHQHLSGLDYLKVDMPSGLNSPLGPSGTAEDIFWASDAQLSAQVPTSTVRGPPTSTSDSTTSDIHNSNPSHKVIRRNREAPPNQMQYKLVPGSSGVVSNTSVKGFNRLNPAKAALKGGFSQSSQHAGGKAEPSHLEGAILRLRAQVEELRVLENANKAEQDRMMTGILPGGANRAGGQSASSLPTLSTLRPASYNSRPASNSVVPDATLPHPANLLSSLPRQPQPMKQNVQQQQLQLQQLQHLNQPSSSPHNYLPPASYPPLPPNHHQHQHERTPPAMLPELLEASNTEGANSWGRSAILKGNIPPPLVLPAVQSLQGPPPGPTEYEAAMVKHTAASLSAQAPLTSSSTQSSYAHLQSTSEGLTNPHATFQDTAPSYSPGLVQLAPIPGAASPTPPQHQHNPYQDEAANQITAMYVAAPLSAPGPPMGGGWGRSALTGAGNLEGNGSPAAAPLLPPTGSAPAGWGRSALFRSKVTGVVSLKSGASFSIKRKNQGASTKNVAGEGAALSVRTRAGRDPNHNQLMASMNRALYGTTSRAARRVLE